MKPRQVNTMMKGFYSGEYNSRNPPVGYYKSFDNRMKSAVNEAFGSKKGVQELYSDLSINRQAFNAAKTYQMSRELQAAARKSKTYDKFLDKALPIYEKYERWGETEINTAVANAQNARHWQQIEDDRDLFPKLRYRAIIDDVTDPEICRPMDGIVVWIDDPIVKRVSPCNHYNCRCLWEQMEKSVRVTSKAKVAALDKEMGQTIDPYFQVNVGQTRQLFGSDHPYFTEVPKNDRAFARKNFGLPIN